MTREERRVITVVFTDLVGFTERSEELDPEDVRSLLTRYYKGTRSILEDHGGTVDKFIGDAVLAVFGAPIAHEDDPERAVRAALAICDWARGTDDVVVRAGVDTGSALVALEQSETGMGIVAGDMVNTASRIQSAARPYGVLVGESAYDVTRDAFEYEERDAIEAKGKREPVRVWEPTGARREETRRPGGVALVGRSSELGLLRDALERARAGTPQLVTLVGVPGIGKTRLVSELERAADDEGLGLTWLEGRSPSYGADASLRSIGEMIKRHARIRETDDAPAAEAKLEAAISGLHGTASDARWLLGHLRPLVGLAGDGSIREEGSEEMFAAWRRFFELLASQSHLVLVFDDLHWADDAVLAFVDDLVTSPTAGSLLVLGTARPELLDRRPDWVEAGPGRTTLTLEPLTEAETGDLVHALAHEVAISADTERALLERAAGNPLYAEEFVRMLAEAGREPDAALPQSVQGIIAARLDALAPAEKALLQDAAVIGQVFWEGALRTVGGHDGMPLRELIDDLERKEFVQPVDSSAASEELELTFRHPLIREVAYEQMPRAVRAEKHVRAAEWAESLPADRADDRADLLSHHYVRALGYARAVGAEVGELRARACHALREAGDHARALHSLAAAAERYERALELSEGEGEGVALELALAEVQLRTGAVEEAKTRLQGVLETARTLGQADVFGRAILAYGGVGTTVFDPDEVLVTLIEEALELLGDHEPDLRSQLTARLAIELYYVPPPSRREELSDAAVRLAREAGAPDALHDALNARHVTLWSPDRLDERLAVARELVELAEASGDRERSLQGRTWLVLDLVESGDLAAARVEIAEYARLVEPLDIPAYAWWVPAWRAMLAGVEGRFEDALRLATEAREIGGRAGDGNAEFHASMVDWQVSVERGREIEGLVQMAEAGVARAGPANAFRCGLAMQHAISDRLDEARRVLTGLGPDGFGSVARDMNFFAGAAEFAIAVGALGDAERAAPAYAILRSYRDRNWVIARAAIAWGPGHSFLGRLAATAGMWDEAEEHFEAGLAACERMGARPMAARTRWWHAEMLRLRGAPGDLERADALAALAEDEAAQLDLALAGRAG